jgi:hypothetical protein
MEEKVQPTLMLRGLIEVTTEVLVQGKRASYPIRTPLFAAFEI